MKVIFLLSAIFAVYLYTASSQRVQCPTDWSGIDADYILVPNPCNCSAYFVCQGEYATPMPCPPGLHFNADKQICDYTNKAHCTRHPNC